MKGNQSKLSIDNVYESLEKTCRLTRSWLPKQSLDSLVRLKGMNLNNIKDSYLSLLKALTGNYESSSAEIGCSLGRIYFMNQIKHKDKKIYEKINWLSAPSKQFIDLPNNISIPDINRLL